MLDKKQDRVIFLFDFKMCPQAAETTCNINNAFGQELLMSIQCTGGSRSFVKEMRAWKMRSTEAGHWKLTVTSWEWSSKLILFQLHEKLLKNSVSTILWLFDIWSKLERWKSLTRGCLMNWLQIKKNHFSVSSSLILCNNNEAFLDWIVMCNKKVDFVKQLVKPAQWVDQEVPKEFPKPTLCEKRSWSLFGGLLPVWSSTAFWTPVKPIHLRSILGKLMRCTQNCNACSQDWSTERTQFFSLTTPVNAAQPKLQKLNKLGYEVLPRLPYSPDLSPANYHLFKHLDNFL